MVCSAQHNEAVLLVTECTVS